MEGLTFKIIEDSQREEFIFICIMSPEAPLLDSKFSLLSFFLSCMPYRIITKIQHSRFYILFSQTLLS